jgi:serine/threonine-protein kinase
MEYLYPRVSPDGGRVALDVRGEENDIWIWDLRAETPSRLVLGEASGSYPVWTPDGTRIAYTDGSRDLWWKAANNTGSPELLVASVAGETSAFPSPYFFTPDGSGIVFRDQQNPDTNDDLAMVSIGSDSAVLWRLNGDFVERNAELSPDGGWMAYESTESGGSEVYVRPFPDVDANQVRVSNNSGYYPLWSRDGRELFYLEEGSPPRLMSVSFEADAASGSFIVGTRTVLMDWPYSASAEGRTYDVSPDGQRFLAVRLGGGDGEAEGSPLEITVVQNWFEEVRQRTGSN